MRAKIHFVVLLLCLGLLWFTVGQPKLSRHLSINRSREIGARLSGNRPPISEVKQGGLYMVIYRIDSPENPIYSKMLKGEIHSIGFDSEVYDRTGNKREQDSVQYDLRESGRTKSLLAYAKDGKRYLSILIMGN